MSQETIAGTAPAVRAACDPARMVTRSLLGYGMMAGPFYLVVTGVQALLRPGFDPARHDASLLANGHLGWVQTVDFLVAGLMVLAAAIGMRRALAGHRGGTWGPRLVFGYGLGLVGAGLFRADPAFGFPPGTPPGPGQVSWHGLAHLAAGGTGFLALVAACLVFARRFAALRRAGWAAYCAASGVLVLAGFVGIATGSGRTGATVAFTVAVVIAWAWLTALSAHLYRHTPEAGAPERTEAES